MQQNKKTIKTARNVFWVSEEFTLIVKNCFQRFRFFGIWGIVDLRPFHVFFILLIVWIILWNSLQNNYAECRQAFCPPQTKIFLKNCKAFFAFFHVNLGIGNICFDNSMQWMHKHSWTPFPHLIKGAGVGPSKNWVTWGVQNFLLERGDKPKKRKWRGCHFLITNSSIIFTVCGENICTFLIHSGSLQKMLTALPNLVWNTQKSKWTIFLNAKGRCFVVLKRF